MILKNKSIINDNFITILETTQKYQNCFKMNVPNYISYSYTIQNCFVFPLEEIRKFRDNINQQIVMNQMIMQNIGMNTQIMFIDQNYNTNKVTVYDCFNFIQKDELMCKDNQIFWYKCNQLSDSIYGNKIFALPNILIMILNRGKNNIYKVIIDFPMEMDLSNYTLSSDNEKYIYYVYGVITHLGESGEGGHFIATCKSPVDGKWYRYYDAFVSLVNDFDKEAKNFNTPYILFYQRIKN